MKLADILGSIISLYLQMEDIGQKEITRRCP